MSAIVDLSLELARQNVRFFPVVSNSKIPEIDHFSERATSEPELLRHMFEPNKNSGIACGKVADNLHLVGFDIDNKPGKPGFQTMDAMALVGETFPATWAQRTPSGGEHRLFWSPVPIRQGTDVCGPGIDLRSDGGYLVGPGSVIDGRSYDPLNHLPIAQFPDWAILKFQKTAKVYDIRTGIPPANVNPVYALKRAVEYLQQLPPSMEGSRNDAGYKIVCRLKDIGIAASQTPDLLRQYWKCQPMLEDEEINHLINSAFKYSENMPGADAPESIFEKVNSNSATEEPKPQHPIDKLNKDHFYVAANGTSRVCWETTNDDGTFHLERFPVEKFHEKYAAKKIEIHGKAHPITKLWMNSEHRRTYDRMRFDPSGKVGANTYNLWRGFAVQPSLANKTYSPCAVRGFEMFKEHILENVCANDETLYNWFMAFFAHMFQFPGDRPRVCLVLKGEKGTGKNAIVERIGAMIGNAAIVLASPKFLKANFNSIMEQKLLVTLDEAFWSGDKSIDGVLKSLVTDERRLIERKGEEAYVTKVYDRIVILGNEERIVNATGDDRRWAVFEIGNGRRKQAKWFAEMRKGLETDGGNELLMRYFLDFDLSKVDLDTVPETAALNEQKEHSAGPFESWWHQCLQEGYLLGRPGDHAWPEKILASELREAFLSWAKVEHSRGFVPSTTVTGRIFSKIAHGSSRRKNVWIDGKIVKSYIFLPLDFARMEWDKYMGFQSLWDE